MTATPSITTQFARMSDGTQCANPDSPISFNHQSLAGITSQENQAALSMPPASERKRAVMGEARDRTTALRYTQQCSSPNPRPRVKRERKARAVVTEDGGSFARDSVEPASTFKCPIKGCEVKPYRRNEHMQRHIIT